MLKIFTLLLSHLMLSSTGIIEEPSLGAPDCTSSFKNIALINLGKYRGFTDDGTEYQKTYFVSRFTSAQWGASRSFCNSYNMELLTLETQSESRAYLDLLDSNNYLKTLSSPHFWIDSMTVTLKSKTEWFWTKTGYKISFPISWYRNEPNNNVGNEFCLFVVKPSNGISGFGDGHCNSLNVYVACQRIDFLIPSE